MSASNNTLRPGLTGSRANAPLLLRGAAALANAVSRLVECVQSEIVDSLANYHLSHHSHRFVLTERDTFPGKHDMGGHDIVQADRAGPQP